MTTEEKANFDFEVGVCTDEAERVKREIEDIVQPQPLRPGDLVRLRSGGPTMTVEGVEQCEDHGAVAHCAWIVDRDNPGRFAEQVQSHSFAAAALVKVSGKVTKGTFLHQLTALAQAKSRDEIKAFLGNCADVVELGSAFCEALLDYVEAGDTA